jgi:hypothetical protein
MLKEIKRKQLVNGDIIELDIKNYGFLYAKYINILSFYPESSYPDLLRIYKKCYKSPIDKLELLDRELLVAPLAIAGIKGIVKTLGCKVIANEVVAKSEEILPEVKRGHPPFMNGYDESKYEKFMVLKNLGDVNSFYFSIPKKVKHLEWAGGTNVQSIMFRIKLELLKLEGKDIKKVEALKDWLEEEVYNRAINLPCYSKLDKPYRDKAQP